MHWYRVTCVGVVDGQRGFWEYELFQLFIKHVKHRFHANTGDDIVPTPTGGLWQKVQLTHVHVSVVDSGVDVFNFKPYSPTAVRVVYVKRRKSIMTYVDVHTFGWVQPKLHQAVF